MSSPEIVAIKITVMAIIIPKKKWEMSNWIQFYVGDWKNLKFRTKFKKRPLE